ncbi:PAAR domain-containing protein [Yoonia sp. R2-816]|uniref:PAAR domain-containing protein n=1 Tax=Yoonia sp. R2-816 TaxID=3342638 RepID=UPI0037281C90
MRPTALLTDKHACPIHGTNAIVKTSTATVCDGKPIALVGDMTACGATIVTGSATTIIDGKPVAVIGSVTSHGGTIVSGSASLKA